VWWVVERGEEREREEGGEKAWEMGNGKGGGNAFFLHRYLGEKMREPVLLTLTLRQG